MGGTYSMMGGTYWIDNVWHLLAPIGFYGLRDEEFFILKLYQPHETKYALVR
jgi:hypothetical protein